MRKWQNEQHEEKRYGLDGRKSRKKGRQQVGDASNGTGPLQRPLYTE